MRRTESTASDDHPQALLLDEPTNHLDLDSIHWLQDFLNRYDGVLITISQDRHFLNSVCTHITDIDYETIITYTGGYDDMVMAKTQIRSQIEGQNAQREKKISQLNEFIARFAAGTRSSQVQSRRKEVERLQVTELAKSNIQRPFLKFERKRPSGRSAWRIARRSPRGCETIRMADESPAIGTLSRPLCLRPGDSYAIAHVTLLPESHRGNHCCAILFGFAQPHPKQGVF